MPGPVPGIHVLCAVGMEDVDGRVKPGHDEEERTSVPVFRQRRQRRDLDALVDQRFRLFR
ncbi:hypothetical protein E4K66_31865 [Bradyrhizobium frederickii]|uniref:Uncharacterized protein n=1 Tax=Bradyrhizobium frederickii TaxID=2560054 RepID=A0A4Y9KX02_9BRAD|nr:hypothetical protein E4K66_31865 [Bradyrhizobium frederickii]